MSSAWSPIPAGLVAQFRMNPDLFQAILGLVALLLLGAAALVWLNRWRKRAAEPAPPPDDLDSYRKLYEQGVLSPEEYERIRARIEGRVREMLTAPKKPPPSDSPSSNGQTDSG